MEETEERIGTQNCGPQTCVPNLFYLYLPPNKMFTYGKGICLWNVCWREQLYRQGKGNQTAKIGFRKWHQCDPGFSTKNWEKLYKNELSLKESRKERETKLAEINAEKGFNDGNEKETYSYAEYMRLRNQCRLLLEKNKKLKKQYTDLREKVQDRGYMK